MTGFARTTNFMLGTAEVMIGPRDKLYEFTPDQNAIGLVKNFVCEVTRDQVELGQGVQNTLVHIRSTGSTARASCEMYEYTSKNLAYALSLDGSSFVDVPGTPRTTTALSTLNSTLHTLTTDTPATPQTFAIGNTVMLREPNSNNINIGVLTAITPNLIVRCDTGTRQFPIGTVVSRCDVLAMGSTAEATEYAAKVTGQLADGTWVSLLFPRIRITSGMTMAFQTDNYGNMPLEWRPMQLVSTDKYFNDFQNRVANFAKDTVKSAVI